MLGTEFLVSRKKLTFDGNSSGQKCASESEESEDSDVPLSDSKSWRAVRARKRAAVKSCETKGGKPNEKTGENSCVKDPVVAAPAKGKMIDTTDEAPKRTASAKAKKPDGELFRGSSR